MTISTKTYSVLFRLFLVVFILAYFMTTGLRLHEKYLFQIPYDYIGHALFCFILFTLYIKSFNHGKIEGALGQLSLRLIVLFILIFLFEVSQQFIPHRSFDWFDVLANFTGMVLGTGVGMAGKRREVRGER